MPHSKNRMISVSYNEKELEIDPLNGNIKLLETKDRENKVSDKGVSMRSLINKISKITARNGPLNKQMSFVLTYDCNFECPYCFERTNGLCGKSTTLSEKYVYKTYQLYENIEYIIIFGGEPLLENTSDIFDLIIHLWPNAIYEVVTNGYNIDLFLDRLVKLNISKVRVTLDGPESIHNKTRIHTTEGATYKKIMQNIRLLIDNCIPIVLRMNATIENYKDCISFRDHLVKTFENSTYLSFFIAPLLQQCTKEREIIDMYLFNVELQRNSATSEYSIEKQNEYLTYTNSFIKSLILKTKYQSKIYFCPAYTADSKYVDFLGDVYSCPTVLGRRSYAVSSLDTNNKVFNDFILAMQLTEECSECEYLLLCGGGCPISLGEDGVLIPNPDRCGRIRFLINHIVPLVYYYLYEK